MNYEFYDQKYSKNWVLVFSQKRAILNEVKNKTPLLIVGGVVLLAVVGFFLMQRSGSSPLSTMTGTPADLVTNALTGSGSVKCEYTDEQGQTVMAYVKNGMVRSDMTGGEAPMSFLMRDKTTYSWNETTKEGFMYKIPEVTPGEEVAVDETDDTSYDPDEYTEEIEQYKEDCKNENVPDSMFEVPGDVNFQDYSAMMENSMQQVPQEYQDQYQQYLNQQQ